MSKENEESISDYRLNTLARNQLIEERTMNGDRACAVLAYSIIVETAQESESRAIKLFRRCVNDRLLSTALNAGMSPEEVGRVWLKAPFRLLEEALRISLSDKNACRAQSANLIAGLRFAAAFSPRASHSIRVKYLISFAKTYPEFLDLFPKELVNDLCLQIVDICLHCDKKELRDYANACMALMKQERLLDTLGAELVPLLNINEPNEKLFRLFEESVFGMILLEKTLLLTNTLINGDQLLKYAEVFVRRPDTICEGIRMVDLIYQRSETIATSSTNRIADASAKTLGYGSRVQLHDRVVRFLLEIDESSELAIRINSTSRDNLLTLPSLTQSAKALVQLGNFIDKNEYSDLANRICTLMLVRPAEEALEAFTTLCAGYVDCSIISALILGFLSLSRKLTLGLVETARYLAPLQQIESLSGHDLLEQFRQETFDREVLHILICWGAYFFDQRLGILRASLEWEHGTLQPSQSVNPESRKSFESLKKLPADCKWPLLLYNSDKAKSLHASAELDANQLDKSFRRVFLAEYSIDDILGLVNDLEESRVIEMTEWYIQQLPPDSFKHIITQVAAGTGEIIIFLKTLCRVSLQAFPCEEALPWLISLLQDETSKVALWLRDAAPKFPSGDSLRYYHSLTGEDIALVKRWNDGKPLSAVEASRLLSARVAEKFLYDILSSFYGRENIRDVSKEQLCDPSVDPEWPRYDIYVTTSEEAIDCKNARKAYNSQFFSQYQIPRFKSQRKKGSSVVYACTLSDYIRAESFDVTSDLSLLQSCHCLQGDVCVSLLGVISQKLFQSLRDCLARHSVPLEITPDQGARDGYFIPEWMLGTSEWIYPETSITEMLTRIVPSCEIILCGRKVLGNCSTETSFGTKSILSDEYLLQYQTELYLQLVLALAHHFQSMATEKEAPRVVLPHFTLLVDLLEAASYRRLKPALFLWWLSELLKCCSGQQSFSESVFSVLPASGADINVICSFIGDPSNYMKMAWDTFSDLARYVSSSRLGSISFVSFRLHTRGILTATDRTGDRSTLLAYCGECGNNPLYAGVHNWCDNCKHLVCDKCGFCSHRCRHHSLTMPL